MNVLHRCWEVCCTAQKLSIVLQGDQVKQLGTDEGVHTHLAPGEQFLFKEGFCRVT